MKHDRILAVLAAVLALPLAVLALDDLVSEDELSQVGPQARRPSAVSAGKGHAVAPKVADPAPEAVPEEKGDVKPEAKPEDKGEAKPEDKGEAKPEVKGEAKPEEKGEAKPEDKGEEPPKEEMGKIFGDLGALDMTADKIEGDFAKNTITWTGHVEIWDAERRIKADKIVVTCDKAQRPVTIEAFGNVFLIADEVEMTPVGKTVIRSLASSDYARVEVQQNTITLRYNPRLVRGSMEATNLTEVVYTYDPKGGRGTFSALGNPAKIKILNPAELNHRWKAAGEEEQPEDDGKDKAGDKAGNGKDKAGAGDPSN